jgi:SAM-dependent methyltransferase
MNKEVQKTHQTYERSAVELAEYFKGIGSRREDIERAFELSSVSGDSNVIELGCGDGRDAAVILEFSPNLTAIDYSNALIEIAKRSNPEHADRFMVEDILTYEPGTGETYDNIFAFASLLHLNPAELHEVLHKYTSHLNDGGVFFISMKMSDHYTEAIKEDKFGWRMFHLYHPDEIVDMMPEELTEVYRETRVIGQTAWFELALKKGNADARE